MSDLKKYIAKRKKTDKDFAEGCEEGCEQFKIGVVEIPIDGVLDLHTFQPREVGELVVDYLALCQERGIGEIRIIHGKGTGQLRRSVHAILGRNPMVQSFHLAGEDGGGWGATIVRLRTGEKNPDSHS